MNRPERFATETAGNSGEGAAPDIALRALLWIVGRDTGLSSRTIWAVMMGVPPVRPYYPADPADFGRCFRLLQAVPEWRTRLSEVAPVSDVWAALIERWGEVEALYVEELAGGTGMAPKCYALMKSIIYPVEERGRAARWGTATYGIPAWDTDASSAVPTGEAAPGGER